MSQVEIKMRKSMLKIALAEVRNLRKRIKQGIETKTDFFRFSDFEKIVRLISVDAESRHFFRQTAYSRFFEALQTTDYRHSVWETAGPIALEALTLLETVLAEGLGEQVEAPVLQIIDKSFEAVSTGNEQLALTAGEVSAEKVLTTT